MAKRATARAFADDLMKGEHAVGHARRQTTSGKGLAIGVTADAYRSPNGEVTDAAYGTSIFDPVLCELIYRWFCPPGGTILDPFAGGSVRGVVAGFLGRRYVGIDLRPEQVDANRKQWVGIAERHGVDVVNDTALVDNPDALTPIEARGDVRVKRDDLFAVGGVAGGKVRTCLALARAGIAAAEGQPIGLVTAGSRASPQVNIVAHIARHLGVPARCHTPTGQLSPEVIAARDAGAEIVQHKAGYNNVIVARARADAAERGWVEIPFGMECAEAIKQTRHQVGNVPADVRRIVMPCGSGMSLAGVLWGLVDAGRHDVEILAVQVGADPSARLDAYAPAGWRDRVRLVPSGSDYHKPAPVTDLDGLALDAHYEAKCLPFLEPGDLLWVVGIRATAAPAPDIARPSDMPAPAWHVGDAQDIARLVPGLQADMVFTCPPYADLERYSDDPRDLSTMDYEAFLAAYRRIIAASVAQLRPDRFAAIVVGDVRGPDGFYRNFPGHTVQAFEDAGARLYNDAILVTAVGSLPVRTGRQFQAGRKLGKTHQQVYIFCKGDARKATKAVGEVDFGDINLGDADE